jgi:hypothetical protein
MRTKKLDDAPGPGWKITPRAEGDDRVERWTKTIRGVLGFVWCTECGWFWLVYDCGLCLCCCGPVTPRWKIIAKGHECLMGLAMDACETAVPKLN